MDSAKRTAYERLRELIAEAESADYRWTRSGKATEWKRGVETALRRSFGDNSDHLREFKGVRYTPVVFTDGSPDSLWVDCFLDGMTHAKAIVRAAIQEVEDYDLSSADADHKRSLPQNAAERQASLASSRRVFIVHGRDVEMKEAVARFVERLGCEAVILSEQANSGRTIIEKFERNADVGFAIILLSPDDIGGLSGDASERQPRARQNAILELGYFLGTLGRQRVCPLVRGHLDLPSDIHGLVYVAFDGDAWRIQLVKELKAAGFEIDANLAF